MNFKKLENTENKFKSTYIIHDEMKTHKGTIFQRMFNKETNEWEEIEIGSNAVLIGGLAYQIYNLYDIEIPLEIDSFEKCLYTIADVNEEPNITKKPTSFRAIIQGYNLHLDGALGGSKLPYHKHLLGFDRNFEFIIPFRVIPVSLDDPMIYMQKYAHRALRTIKGQQYAFYYTKRLNKSDIKSVAQFTNGANVPDHPDRTAAANDLDSRVINSFEVQLENEELVEFFRLFKDGGAESTRFNGISLAMGYPAEIMINGNKYDTLKDTRFYTRANHMDVPKGVSANGKSNVLYEIASI